MMYNSKDMKNRVKNGKQTNNSHLFKCLTAFTAVLFLLTGFVWGADFYWGIDNENQAWTDSSGTPLGGIPGPDDTVIVASGSDYEISETVSYGALNVLGNVSVVSGGSLTVSGTVSVSGILSTPSLFAGNIIVASSGTIKDFDSLNVSESLHTAGSFLYNENASVIVSKGFYNTGSIVSSRTLNLTTEGFDNQGTVNLSGNSSVITVTRHFGDSSTDSVYPNLVLDPGSENLITIAAGAARIDSVTTTGNANNSTITVLSGNFGSFSYDGIFGGILKIEKDTSGKFANTGSPHFENLNITNSSSCSLSVTGTPYVENLVLSGTPGNLLQVNGSGKITVSQAGSHTGNYISFDYTAPVIEGGQFLVSNSTGTMPDGWYDGNTTYVWVGGSGDSSWNNAANWLNGRVPAQNDGTATLVFQKDSDAVTLPALGVESINLKRLIIFSGASFDAGGNNLVLYGDLENDGTFLILGNLSFDGNTTHTVKKSISTTGNVEVKTGSTLSAGSGVNISASRFINSGKTNLSGKVTVTNAFTDKSSNDSSYGEVVLTGPGNITVTGNNADSSRLVSIGVLKTDDTLIPGSITFKDKIKITNSLSLKGASPENLLPLADSGIIEVPDGYAGFTGGNLSFGGTSGPVLIGSSGTSAGLNAGLLSYKADSGLPSGWSPVVYTWTGSIGQSWIAAENWKNGAVPGSQSGAVIAGVDPDVVIPAGCTNYPKLTGNVSIGEVALVIENGASLDLNGQTFSTDNKVVNKGTVSTSVDGGTINAEVESAGIFAGGKTVKISKNLLFTNTDSKTNTASIHVTGNAVVSGSGNVIIDGNLSADGNVSVPDMMLQVNKNLTVLGKLSVTGTGTLSVNRTAESVSSAGEFEVTTERTLNFGDKGNETPMPTFTVKNGGFHIPSETTLIAGSLLYSEEENSSIIIDCESIGIGNGGGFGSPVIFTNGLSVSSSNERNLYFLSDVSLNGKSLTTGTKVILTVEGNISDADEITINDRINFKSSTVTSSGNQTYNGNIYLGKTENTFSVTGTDKSITLGSAGKNLKEDGSTLYIKGTGVTLNQIANSPDAVSLGVTAGSTVKLGTPLNLIKGGLILNGDLNANGNKISLSGNSALNGTLTSSDGVYFYNGNEAKIDVSISAEQEIANLYLSGNIDVDCDFDVTKIQNLFVKRDDSKDQSTNFTINISGDGSISAKKLEADRNGSNNYPNVRGILKLALPVSFETEMISHSGTEIYINNTCTTPLFKHVATNAVPETKLFVNGILNADEINLTYYDNSGSQLNVNNSGKVNTKKLYASDKFLNKKTDNTVLSDAVINNGEINATGTSDTDGFSLPSYSGSGKLSLSGKGQFVNASTSDLTIAELKLKDISAAVIDAAGGNVTVTKLTVTDTSEGTSSLTTKGKAGTNKVTLNGNEGFLNNLDVFSGTLSLDSSVSLQLKGDFSSEEGTTVSGSGAVTTAGAFTNKGTYSSSGTITSSGELNNSGTISGNGYVFVAGNFTDTGTWIGSGTIIFNGDAADQKASFVSDTVYPAISCETSGINLILNTSLSCDSLLIKDGSVFDSNDNNISLTGALNVEENGTFLGKNGIHETGTDLNVSGTVTLVSGIVTAGKNLTVAGTLNAGSATIEVSGNVIVSETGTLKAESSKIKICGDWTLEENGSFNCGTGEVEFTKKGTASTVHSISGESTFYNLSCVQKGDSLVFESNKKQIVSAGGKLKIHGGKDSDEKPVYVTLAASSSDQWKIDVSPLSLDLNYVKIVNSESIKNIPGASPSVRLEKNNNCLDGGNNTFWFAETVIYWYGGINSKWNTKENWKKDPEGNSTVIVTPEGTDTALEVYIVKDSGDTGFNTLVLENNITPLSFEIPEGKTVGLSGNGIEAEKITHNGTIIVSGAKDVPLKKVSRTEETPAITHGTNSLVIFEGWTDNTAIFTTSTGLGYTGGFGNLKISGTDRFVFAGLEGGEASSDVVVNGSFSTNASSVSSGAKNQNYKAAVTTSENIEFVCDSENLITFEKTVNASKNLKINGNGKFQNSLTAKKLEITNDVTFEGSVTADNISVTGKTKINTADITANDTDTGTQVYSGAVTLLKNTVLTANKVTFNNTVSGAYNIEIKNAEADPVAGTGALSGNCVISTDTVNGINIKSLSVSGTTGVKGKVTTTAEQNYTGTVSLNGDSSFTGTSVTFTGKLDGSYNAEFTGTTDFGNTVEIKNLTVNGPVTFNGDADVNKIDVSGTANIYTGSIKTVSSQNYSGAVSGSEDNPEKITFTASDVTFGSTVTSKDDLVFDCDVNVNGGSISNKGYSQTYNNPVTVSEKDAVFTAKKITFQDTINSGAKTVADSTVTYGFTATGEDGTVIFNGSLGTVTALKNLTVENPVTVNCSDVKTSGNQLYKSKVTLSKDVEFTGSFVTFENIVSGSQFLEITGNTAFGNKVNVKNLSVSGTTEINAETITASSSEDDEGVLLTGAVTLKCAAQITGNNISCPAGISGDKDITLSADTKVNLGGTSSLGKTVIEASTAEISGTLTSGILDLNSDAAFNSMELKNSGLFTLFAGKKVEVRTKFTQSGSGMNLLKGSLTTTGTATVEFKTPVYTALNTDTALTLGGGSGKITLKDNLIVSLADAGHSLTVSSPLLVKNLVLYKGILNVSADLSSDEDIVLLGSNYSGEAAEGYTKPRRASYNYKGFNTDSLDKLPDADSTALPVLSGTALGGTLNVGAGKIINPGLNFYANGLNLHGTSDWYIDTDCNTDGSRFIEAYNCDLSESIVRYKAPETAAVGNNDKACGLAQDCTFDNGSLWDENDYDNIGSNENWDFPPFRIKSIETVSDNVIKVVFSGKVRNNNREVSDRPNYVYFDEGISFGSVYISGFFDSSEGLWKGTTLGTSETSEIYFMTSAGNSWNTDATGTNAGNAFSTDSHGEHKNVVPKIMFTRDVENNIVFTNRVGKILSVPDEMNPTENYFVKTTDGAAPVLVGLKTGQETHTPWDSVSAELSQPSFDAHNFMEFIFSEPVDFDDSAAGGAIQMPAFIDNGSGPEKNVFENIRVENELGAVSESGSGLEIAGLVKISSGKLKTGIEGTADNTVHSFYRKQSMNECSLRISIAGFTDGIVTDNDGLNFKKWIGYIDDAVTPSGSVTLLSVENAVTDLAVEEDGVTLKHNKLSSVKNGGLTVTRDGDHDYGLWDVSKPEFAYIDNRFEIIGSVVNGSASIKRIEYHLFDNQYDSFKNLNAEWIFRRGWVTKDTDNLIVADSYASDKFGGARPFVQSDRTSGGIRYSSICNARDAFSYKIGNDDVFHDFADKKAYFGATSPFFDSTRGTSRMPDKPDTPYFSLELPSYVQSLQTIFTLKFDQKKAYVTDLAGNRLSQDMQMQSLDRTPPTLAMTIAPVGQKKLYMMFGKNILLKEKISARTDAGDLVEKELNSIISNAFELGTITGSVFTPNTASQLMIDSSVAPKILYQNTDYCGIELALNKEVTYADIDTLYLRAKAEAETYKDLTGLPSDTYTFIQDELGNFLAGYSAHVLSDFAVNLVNPQYAYNDMVDSNGELVQENLFETGSFAVHDWNEEQNNFGTLVAGKGIHVVAEIKDEKLLADNNAQLYLRGYFDHSPDAASISKDYNSAAGQNLRVWVPFVTGTEIFSTIAKTVNTAALVSDSTYVQEGNISKGFDISLSETDVSKTFAGGNQVTFLFGLMEKSGGTIVNKLIDHAPENNRDVYTVNKTSPFFALRLKNPEDILSLDLWSFKLKEQIMQRGGVSIFNNVINVTNGEKALLKVDNPKTGKVDVMVMTIDGDIVDYLNRGSLEAGTTNFTWNGKNRAGKAVARGIYFIRVIGNGFDETRKVMVVK